MTLTTFFIIVLIIVVIVVALKFEYRYFTKKLKHIIKCPIKYEVHDDIVIYNKKYKDELHDLLGETIDEYKYEYNPKVLISSRITRPVNDFVNEMKNAHKETIVSDLLNSTIPFYNMTTTLLDNSCDYGVLSKKSDLNIVYNNGYVLY